MRALNRQFDSLVNGPRRHRAANGMAKSAWQPTNPAKQAFFRLDQEQINRLAKAFGHQPPTFPDTVNQAKFNRLLASPEGTAEQVIMIAGQLAAAPVDNMVDELPVDFQLQ